MRCPTDHVTPSHRRHRWYHHNQKDFRDPPSRRLYNAPNGSVKFTLHDIRMNTNEPYEYTRSVLGLQPCTSDTCMIPLAFHHRCKVLLAKGHKACAECRWRLLIAEMTDRWQYDALALAQHAANGSCMLRCCYPAGRQQAVCILTSCQHIPDLSRNL